jgi:Tol biopolymer transport system component
MSLRFVLTLSALSLPVPAASAQSCGAGATEHAAIGHQGVPGFGTSTNADISGDGRYVAFNSSATDLVPGDTNAKTDVFVRDRATGAVERVSVATGGAQANGSSLRPTITSNGRFVAFESAAFDLIPSDVNGQSDVFLHDRLLATTSLVSAGTGVVQADEDCFNPAVSEDGRWVAFTSEATTLVPNDTNFWADIFLRDMQTGSLERISVGPGGQEGDGPCFAVSISADGRWIAFDSLSTNLTATDGDNWYDVFVYDRLTGALVEISTGLGGAPVDGNNTAPTLSADGRYVCFVTTATNIVAGDVNGRADAVVHDRLTGARTLASVASGGQQANGDTFYASIAANAGHVTFHTDASNLVAGDTNGHIDAFVRDLAGGTTERVSVGPNGVQANGFSFRPQISADGRYVAFWADASNLAPADVDQVPDAFVHDRCAPCPAPVPYCTSLPNSTGAASFMGATGSTSVAADDLSLYAVQCPPESSALFYYGTATGQTPFGDGNRCVFGATFRLAPLATSGAGNAVHAVVLAQPPEPAGLILAGSVWHFQLWYRDVNGPLGSGFNFSDGLSITFCP